MSKKKKLIEYMEDKVVEFNALDYDLVVAGDGNEAVLWLVAEDAEIIACYAEWHAGRKLWFGDDISEMEGPASLTCPVRFFEIATKNTFPEWRHYVKEYHENRGISVQEGEVALQLQMALEKRWNSNP